MQFKLFVGNLPQHFGDTELEEIFDGPVEIQSDRVITDHETGMSRGYGFVEMQGNDMSTVIDELNGREVDGQELRVNEAYERRNNNGNNRRRATNVHHERTSFGSPYREGRSMSDPHRHRRSQSNFGSPYREGRSTSDPHRHQQKRNSFGSPFREGRSMSDPHGKRHSSGNPNRKRGPRDR